MAKSYTLTRVPRADLVGILSGLVLLIAAWLGVPAEILDELTPEQVATLLSAGGGLLVGVAASVRAAWYRRKIDDPTVIGDRSITKSKRKGTDPSELFARNRPPTIPAPPDNPPPTISATQNIPPPPPVNVRRDPEL